MVEVTTPPNRLRELREEAGLSQAALAAAVGVSKQAISDFELGDRAPSLTAAALIARVLSDSLVRRVTVDGVFLAGGSSDVVDALAASAGAVAPTDGHVARSPDDGAMPDGAVGNRPGRRQQELL